MPDIKPIGAEDFSRFIDLDLISSEQELHEELESLGIDWEAFMDAAEFHSRNICDDEDTLFKAKGMFLIAFMLGFRSCNELEMRRIQTS